MTNTPNYQIASYNNEQPEGAVLDSAIVPGRGYGENGVEVQLWSGPVSEAIYEGPFAPKYAHAKEGEWILSGVTDRTDDATGMLSRKDGHMHMNCLMMFDFDTGRASMQSFSRSTPTTSSPSSTRPEPRED